MRPEDAARALASARGERRTLERFTATEPDLDEAWGLAVQDLDRAARLAAGQRVTGAKLGLTSTPKQRTMGVHQPIVGFLTDAMAEGAFDVDALAQPRIEPEVAFVLATDLAGPVADVRDVVASVCVALEVLDSRWTGYRFGLADVLADNTSAAGYLLGAPAPRPADLRGREARWYVDGKLRSTTTPAAILGDPLAALAHLATHLGRRGEVLPAGSVVLAGAMTDAVPLLPGTSVRIEVDGLEPLTWTRPAGD
ncbi:2-keto-4-pentenoate hydratase [Nocardioides sp. LS1]|uniref:2-keto-4-pentenoate hydratase n=1 Tax=Nocardioides sp. LS1 TaxID=1027620 RepID=UPI000F62832D|nr:fumarylacetoacetate hydrolase family protein [Nocardioides sp. LS1]GCD90343.1 4-oxalocrotonate decarboxylase [Nocardioides sp. LS1]